MSFTVGVLETTFPANNDDVFEKILIPSGMRALPRAKDSTEKFLTRPTAADRRALFVIKTADDVVGIRVLDALDGLGNQMVDAEKPLFDEFVAKYSLSLNFVGIGDDRIFYSEQKNACSTESLKNMATFAKVIAHAGEVIKKYGVGENPPNPAPQNSDIQVGNLRLGELYILAFIPVTKHKRKFECVLGFRPDDVTAHQYRPWSPAYPQLFVPQDIQIPPSHTLPFSWSSNTILNPVPTMELQRATQIMNGSANEAYSRHEILASIPSTSSQPMPQIAQCIGGICRCCSGDLSSAALPTNLPPYGNDPGPAGSAQTSQLVFSPSTTWSPSSVHETLESETFSVSSSRKSSEDNYAHGEDRDSNMRSLEHVISPNFSQDYSNTDMHVYTETMNRSECAPASGPPSLYSSPPPDQAYSTDYARVGYASPTSIHEAEASFHTRAYSSPVYAENTYPSDPRNSTYTMQPYYNNVPGPSYANSPQSPITAHTLTGYEDHLPGSLLGTVPYPQYSPVASGSHFSPYEGFGGLDEGVVARGDMATGSDVMDVENVGETGPADNCQW